MNGIIQWLGDTVRLWGRSLAIFMPKNASLFGLVTLNAIVKAYVQIVLRWWWLLLATGALMVASYKTSYVLGSTYGWIFLFCLQLFIFYLIVRPSVDRKSLVYVAQYKLHFVWFVLYILAIALSFPISIMFDIIVQYGGLWKLMYIPYAAFLLFATIARFPIIALSFIVPLYELAFNDPLFLLLFLYPFTSYFTFFLLDTHGGIVDAGKSLYRAMLMQLYTLPLSVIGTLLTYLVYYGAQQYLIVPVMSLFGGVLSPQAIVILIAIKSLLLIPIIICFWSNVYIKQIHDNFKMYCGTQC